MSNTTNKEHFIKRWLIVVRSEITELVSSDERKMPLHLRFAPSGATLLTLTSESKSTDLMNEAQFDELVARLKMQYFSQECETIDY